jgi:hypothetical protein
MLASRVINQARVLLNDPDAVRWTDAELLAWLNGGQLQIVAVRPDMKTATVDLTLVAGVEQSIPTTGLRLIDVKRNVDGPAVTLVSRDQLNEFDPDWYVADPSDYIRHFMFDDAVPKAFEVYPPANAGQKVRVVHSVVPTDCADLAASIDLDDTCEGPLIDWVCYRAWSKDGDSPQDGAKAANAITTFMNALQVKTQTDQATRPARK